MSKSFRGVAELCEQENIGSTKLYDLFKNGQLVAKKLDGRTIVLNSEWERFLETLPDAVMGARKGQLRGRKPKQIEQHNDGPAADTGGSNSPPRKPGTVSAPPDRG